MNNTLKPQLRQRGRASVDFLAHVFYGTASARKETHQRLKESFGDGASLPDDLDERHDAVTGVLSEVPAYRCSKAWANGTLASTD